MTPEDVEPRAEDEDLHAPRPIDIELLHALRRLTPLGEQNDGRASPARADFGEFAIVRDPHVTIQGPHLGTEPQPHRL